MDLFIGTIYSLKVPKENMFSNQTQELLASVDIASIVRSNNLTNSLLNGLYSSQSGAVSISNFYHMWVLFFRKLCGHVPQMMFKQNTYIILMLTWIISHSWQLSDFIALDGQKTSCMICCSAHSPRLQTA